MKTIPMAALAALICCAQVHAIPEGPADTTPEFAEREAINFARTSEATLEAAGPEFQLALTLRSSKNRDEWNARALADPSWVGVPSGNSPNTPAGAQWTSIATSDPTRYPDGTGPNGAAFYENEAHTEFAVYYDRGCARNTAKLWMPKSWKPGDAPLPGVIIQNGSIQATQPMYWWMAQRLVREGYAVMSFDPRGQGRSDLQNPQGEQGGNINSEVFFTGMVDAIDFFRSSLVAPYPHNQTCAGTYPTEVATFNPFHAAIDPRRLGIAGHSLGASGISSVQGYAGSAFAFPDVDGGNPVDALVAWDSLGFNPEAPPRVPAMGQTSEYSLAPVPKRASPDPEGHKAAFAAYQAAGVPAYQFTIQGSTHYEWSLVPAFPATSWCADISSGSCLGGWGRPMAEHYSLAWFDRWLKLPGEPGYADADARLLDDAGEHGCQKLSFYSRSARDYRDRGGQRHASEDIRADCLAGKISVPAPLPASASPSPTPTITSPGSTPDGSRDGDAGRFGGAFMAPVLLAALGFRRRRFQGHHGSALVPSAFVVLLVLCGGVSPAAAQQTDCLGPAPEAQPGTPAWSARDADNIHCSNQRLRDSSANRLEDDTSTTPLRDGYREPQLHAGRRFRFDTASVTNRGGAALPVEIYRPCTASTCSEVPAGLVVQDGPYPTIVVVHGGASGKELHRWATQSLAEAGYMALAFDVAENGGGDHGIDAQDIIDWLFSVDFPVAADLRRDRVGIAGHSQGASTASLLGQIDERLKVIVAWDNLTEIKANWEDDLGVDPPADIVISKPALGIGADYYFTPQPNPVSPEPAPYNGEGGRSRGATPHPKDSGYQELKAAKVDTMMFMIRAATHLDFTPTTRAPASAYGEAVSTYLTIAWFDRYLRGMDDPALARDAYVRLVGSTRFDDSADIHSIGAGLYDLLAGNQPYKIADTSICDRLSFYFKSRYALRAPDSDTILNSEDLRTDCYAGKTAALPAPASTALPPLAAAPPSSAESTISGGGRFGGAFGGIGLLLAMALRLWAARRARVGLHPGA